MAPRAQAPARRREEPERKKGRGRLLAILAVLAIAAIVIIALLSSGGGTQIDPVDTGDAQQQIDGLRDLIQRNTGRVQE